MIGRIFDVQRFSVHDGPGIRTTVFMKGCLLNCEWCHNPEGLISDIQIKFSKRECIGCKRCGEKTFVDIKKCPTRALSICGKDITSQELLSQILKDKSFYAQNGGVTFSGGECLLQSNFVEFMLKISRENGLNTAVDTSGYVNFEDIKKTVPYCDLYLYDIKIMDNELHKKYTGVENKIILENLRKLSELTDNIWVRLALIPDVNDNLDNIYALIDFILSLSIKPIVTLIPYHGLGISKYETLGIKCKYSTKKSITNEKITEFREIFAKNGIVTN